VFFLVLFLILFSAAIPAIAVALFQTGEGFALLPCIVFLTAAAASAAAFLYYRHLITAGIERSAESRLTAEPLSHDSDNALDTKMADKRNIEAEGLIDVLQALSNKSSCDAVAQALSESLLEFISFSRLTISLASAGWEEIHEYSAFPIESGKLPPARAINADEFPEWESFKQGASFKLYNTPFDNELERFLQLTDEPNTAPRTILVLPVPANGEPSALLVLESNSEDAFTRQQVDFISRLTRHIGSALKNAEYRMLEHTRYAQLQIISLLPQRILESTNVEMILQETGKYLIESFNYDNVFLFLVDDILEELYLFSSVGKEADFIDIGLRLGMGEGLQGLAAKAGEYKLSNDCASDPRFANPFPDTLPVKSEIAIPIKKAGSTIGVLDVVYGKSGKFGENDVSLLETIANLLATALVNAYSFECLKEHSETLEAYKEHLAGDLSLASRLQNNLLPWDFVHPNLEVSLKYIPQEDIGGDYAKIAHQGDWIYIVIGDVSGHGITAALVMSGINSEIERLISQELHPSNVAYHVNNYIAENFSFMGLYLTFFCSRLNTLTGRLEYINAGHQPVIVQNPDKSIIALESSNFPLGLLKEEFPKHIAEDNITVIPGSRMLLYTDGLINERSGYDESKLVEILDEFSDKQVNEVAEHIMSLSTLNLEGAKAEDDRLVVSVEYRDKAQIHEVFSSFGDIDRIEKKLVKLCRMLSYNEDDIMVLHLATYEMMVNAVKHGHKFDSAKRAIIEGNVFKDHWMLTIEDEGKGFNIDEINEYSLDILDVFRASGRGILLTKKIVDDLYYENNGRKVTIMNLVSELVPGKVDIQP